MPTWRWLQQAATAMCIATMCSLGAVFAGEQPCPPSATNCTPAPPASNREGAGNVVPARPQSESPAHVTLEQAASLPLVPGDSAAAPDGPDWMVEVEARWRAVERIVIDNYPLIISAVLCVLILANLLAYLGSLLWLRSPLPRDPPDTEFPAANGH